MIDVSNLHISFDTRDVLNGVFLDVNAGETLVLMGRNGSGKSVFLKIIAGLIKNYSGTVKINGNDINGIYSPEGFDKSYSEIKIAYVFQKGGLFDSMSVFDNTAFGLRRLGFNEDEIFSRVDSVLDRVGLKGSEYKLPSEISGGMQKRAGLARAICIDPEIILYDDPSAGLDPILSDSIADLIIDIKKDSNTTAIAVTHDLAVAKKIADKIALLYEGEIVFWGIPDDFFSKENKFAKQFIEGDPIGPIDIFSQ
ncbi:MAG: ATP-binding cassette domain-containing protein [Spirochaetota bacterium]